MKLTPFPYLIAFAVGAAYGAIFQAFGQIAILGVGLALAAAFAFAPPLPGLLREHERVGQRAATSAVLSFFLAGAAVWGGIFIVPHLSVGPSLTSSEQRIAHSLFWLMSWGLAIGATLWALLMVRPRKNASG